MSGEVVGDFLCAVARDEGDFSDFLCWIDDVEESDEFVGSHAGSDLDADGVT